MHRAASARLVLAARILLAALLGARAAGADPEWRPIQAPAGLERAEALALDPGGGRLAAGGERGAALGPLAGPLERVLARGPIRALVFARGALWAAGEPGLYRIEDGGGVRAEHFAPGEAARSVRDLDALGEALAAATDAGVFISEAPGRWRRVTGLPSGEATRVALRAAGGGAPELWAVIGGSLWRADPDGEARRVPLPAAVSGEGPIDLARGAGGALWVLLPRAVAALDADGSWRSSELVLPPGALAGHLVAGQGALWVATDAGLLTAASERGPWRRAAPPAGHSPVSALAGAGDALALATSGGLWRAAPPAAAPLAAGPPPDARAGSGDPPVRAVHRAALRHLELEPLRMHALARAVRRSAWLPSLRLRLDYGQGRDRALDYDQAFVSGETRLLVDRDYGRDEDYGGFLELQWDLGETVFHPDRIDVSREARLVMQLRDDVLDEINQLYFERQRVLAALAAPPPDAAPGELRLRAAELAAGIDAWTGGWFSAQLDGDGDGDGAAGTGARAP